MLRAIYNVFSGRNYKWNQFRKLKFTHIETIVSLWYPSSDSSQYFPFILGASELVDDFLSPHRKEKSIKCNPDKITYEMYSELIDVTAASFIQIYLNVSNEDEAIKNTIKDKYLLSALKFGIKFEDLKIDQFIPPGDPDIQEITSYILSEYRRIVNAPPATFFEIYHAIGFISATFEFIIDLKKSNEVTRLIPI